MFRNTPEIERDREGVHSAVILYVEHYIIIETAGKLDGNFKGFNFHRHERNTLKYLSLVYAF